MASLTTQTNYVSAVIQLQKQQLNYQTLENYLNNSCSLWAYIVHDKDTHDDGTSKGLHIHIKMILSTESRPRLSTTLNTLTTQLNIDKTAVTIEKMESVAGSIQYLIHMNDANKYQYDVKEIKTNLSESQLNTYLYAFKDDDELDTQSLVDICSKQRSKINILLTMGLRNYTKYRGVISDIVFELECNEHSSL